ncbi:MAG: cold shock domain-containing protein [Deltaproteobacteria bacterium]|nr:cold shock domain-containing protein [Deltaproteobacteria bacterium]
MNDKPKLAGKIKWFNDMKGYGFITALESGQDVFVHYSEIEENAYKTLSEGETVEFEVTEGTRGPQAIHVTKLMAH